MLSTKSIDKIITFSIALSVLSIIFMVLFKNRIDIDYKYPVLILLSSNVFICLVVVFKDKVKFLVSYLIAVSIFYLSSFLLFKPIRNIFPTTNVKGSEVVGFYNYFEYPIFFDLFFFIVILLAPVIIFFLIKKLNDK